jgi:uncharacterized protein YndB with AHSA1/START domain
MVIERTIDAPRELVFRAFTEPEHLIVWWGPAGYTNTFHEIDVRPGGSWRFVMHDPDGTDYDNFIRYVEVTPPERIVYLHGESEDDPNPFESTITLEDIDGKTRVTLRALFASAEIRDMVVREVNALERGKETLARLAAHVATMS